MHFFVVWTTAPDLKSARKLARILVARKLAACVSFGRSFESVYRWKGKIKTADEILLIIKTSKALLDPLEKTIQAHHPYELPEFLAVEAAFGSKDYLKWIKDSLK